MLTEEECNLLYQRIEAQLGYCEKIQIYRSSNWYTYVPKQPGIYIIRNLSNEIVYVGETSNLQERMNDLKDTRHHTLRRAVGHMEFSCKPNFQKATSKKKFLENIEKFVTEFFKANLSLTYCATKIGRKEIEEYLVKKYKPKYNSLLGRRYLN